MSKNYTHLSLEQRYQIEALLSVGCTQKQIAIELKVHPSTISRELGRNTALRGKLALHYKASNAQRRADLRHRHKPKHKVFKEHAKRQVMALMKHQKWSPELISHVLRLEGEVMVSTERIYQWIWHAKHSNRQEDRPFKQAYKYLRHGRRRRKRGNRKDSRGVIHGRISIEQRPSIIKRRERAGDLEVDLMLGKDHKGAVLVMTDRATLHTRLQKLVSRDSHQIVRAIMKSLKESPYKIHTLTFDNDQAFSGHLHLAKQLQVQTYFTRPYTSQDKGTVENRIGVLRRFLPKKTDLNFVTHKKIKQIQALLNERPVRKFNYQTPNQVLQQKIALAT
jgi:transposase, IS30 family